MCTPFSLFCNTAIFESLQSKLQELIAMNIAWESTMWTSKPFVLLAWSSCKWSISWLQDAVKVYAHQFVMVAKWKYCTGSIIAKSDPRSPCHHFRTPFFSSTGRLNRYWWHAYAFREKLFCKKQAWGVWCYGWSYEGGNFHKIKALKW